MKTVSVFAPGTVANIGCGFDVMGLALDSAAGDEMEVTLYDSEEEMKSPLGKFQIEMPSSEDNPDIMERKLEPSSKALSPQRIAWHHAACCNLILINESLTELPEKAERNVITPAIEAMVTAYFQRNNKSENNSENNNSGNENSQKNEDSGKEKTGNENNKSENNSGNKNSGSEHKGKTGDNESVIEKGLGQNPKLHIAVKILKKIVPGSGIGSSAASSAAAVFGLNYVLGQPFNQEELVVYAMEGEKLISGTAHADNVAPALLGGVIFIRSYNPLDLIRLPVPSRFFCTVVHPHIMVSTKQARDILPTELTRKDAITQWGNVGGFIAGLVLEDMELLGRSVIDVVAEPYRKKFIPGYDRLKEDLMQSGMLGVNISGSGPSVFALSTSVELAYKAKQIMAQHFAGQHIEADVYVSKVGKQGARIIEPAP